MSDAIAQGVKVIQTAETALRDLMQDAVSNGQYEQVAVLARWAEQLSQLGANGSSSSVASRARANGSVRDSSDNPRQKRRSPRRSKSKYPMFRRSGDALVKIAWSKASKSEYQHLAPRDVAETLLEKMQTLSHDEELLTMDKVFPLTMKDGAEIPSYQSYVCLAWLRKIGAVTQHGRQGYSVVGDRDGSQVIEQHWSELPLLKR
jgi:hypothetical protein